MIATSRRTSLNFNVYCCDSNIVGLFNLTNNKYHAIVILKSFKNILDLMFLKVNVIKNDKIP